MERTISALIGIAFVVIMATCVGVTKYYAMKEGRSVVTIQAHEVIKAEPIGHYEQVCHVDKEYIDGEYSDVSKCNDELFFD